MNVDELLAEVDGLTFHNGKLKQYAGTWRTVYELLYSRLLSPAICPYLLPELPATYDKPWDLPGWTLSSLQEPISEAKCLHIFTKGESVYSCRDCSASDYGFLCSSCFDIDQHQGHDVSFTIHSYGPISCACGNDDAFIRPFQCRQHAHSRSERLPPMPKDVIAELRQRIATALDYCIRIWTDAPAEAQMPKTITGIFDIRSPAEIANMLADDAGVSQGPWSVVLWNDEKHLYEQVTTQLKRALPGMSNAQALRFAIQVDEYGRAIIFSGSGLGRLFAVGSMINAIDLQVNIRNSHSIFRETVSGGIIDWLNDLAACHFGRDPACFRSIIAEVLLSPSAGHSENRLQQIIPLESRLWKRARLGLRELYTRAFLSDSIHRISFAQIFIRSYHSILPLYLWHDREPEYSLIAISPQLFVMPSVGHMIAADRDFLPSMICSIFAFLTEQYVSGTSTKQQLQHPPDWNAVINLESREIKNKRFIHVLSDVLRLLNNPAIKRALPGRSDVLMPWSSVCRRFTDINPNTRETRQHVEYEGESWATAFNLSMHLARIGRAVGACFEFASAQELERARQALARAIIAHPTFSSFSGPQRHKVTLGDQSAQTIAYDVATSPVSFHHPLSWTLAEICKYNSTECHSAPLVSDGESPISLAELGMQIGEPSLRAQIRAGMWVRNGINIRAQQLHYREGTLREFSYEQDLSLMQFLLSTTDASTFLLTMIDRFGMVGWFDGTADIKSLPYDAAQGCVIAEEFLSLLCVLITEPSLISGWDEDRSVRRDICQALALGSASHSEIIKRMPDRSVDSPAFARSLAEVSSYRQPQGPFDYGVYYLREDLYHEISPYYFRYNRNQRDECAKLINSSKDKAKDKVADIQPIVYSARPYASLKDVLSNRVFVHIVAFGLQQWLSRGSMLGEAFLDLNLYLLQVALVNNPDPFVQQMLEMASSSGLSIVSLLGDVNDAKVSESAKAKCAWLQASLHAKTPTQTDMLASMSSPRSLQFDLTSMDTMQIAADAQRAAAKARQAAIMAQFAQTSKALLESLDSDESDVDEDGSENAEKLTIHGTCLVCQEGLTNRSAFGALALLQTSRLVRETRADGRSKTVSGIHASACGHMMHIHCFETYCQSAEARHNAAPQRKHPEDLGRREFICPLCKSLGNVMLPVHASSHAFHEDVGGPGKQSTANLCRVETEMQDLLKTIDSSQLYKYNLEGGTTANDLLSICEDLTTSHIDSDDSLDRRILNRFNGVAWPLVTEALPSDAGQGPEYDMVQSVVGYTLACLEIACRDTSPFALHLDDKTRLTVRGLSLIVRERVGLHGRDACSIAACACLHDLLFGSKDLVPDGTAIRAAVVVRITSPHLAHWSSTYTFYLQLCQILVRSDTQKLQTIEGEDEICLNIGQTVLSVCASVAPGNGWMAPWTNVLAIPALLVGQHLLATAMPFMKQLALLNVALSDYSRHVSINSLRELASLAQVRLPSELGTEEVLDLGNRMRSWMEAAALSDSEFSTSPYLPQLGQYNLVELPHRYDDIVQQVAHAACPNCGLTPSDPAVCLICGALVCNQSYCCTDKDADEASYGECNTHMWSCGGSSGVFFLIKKCVVVYLHANSGTYVNPPYLDVYGEADLGHRRHKLQYLHMPRYSSIRENWLKQAIPTIVARKLEAGMDSGGWMSL